MKKFYEEILGLDILYETISEVTLGNNNNILLILRSTPHLHPAQPHEAGLYHFALLFSSQQSLAQTIFKIFRKAPGCFTGSADHLVSEAFYFSDPEGNGIELYYDRNPSTWQWEQGQIKMTTLYLDPTEYIKKYINLDDKDNKITLGHIHLKVGNIEIAKKFYVDILKFEITATFPSALFLSVDGYHHHLGLNVWESEGADKRSQTLGLQKFTLTFSEKKFINEIKQNLLLHHISFTEQSHILNFQDPWDNLISSNLV